jgi:proteasome assembly chaperone (PAC2) family protein
VAYVTIGEQPTLRRPVLLLAFTGWVDGGQVSTSAVRFLVDRWKAKKFAELDPEAFYNFSRVRPQVHLEPDFSRRITWPETAFYYHADPQLDRDFVLLLGIEPNFKWRTFSEEILRVCQSVGVVSALSLGGVIADVLHSRRPQITTFTSDPDLLARFPELGRRRGGYQGPTGIIGVLSDDLTRVGIPFGNMRGAVPHYVAGSPSPKVSHALLARVSELYGLRLDLSELADASRRFEKQVDEALTRMPDAAEYVRRLEARSEPEPTSEAPRTEGGAEELPSAEDIVREFEELLRERPSNGDGEEPPDPQP